MLGSKARLSSSRTDPEDLKGLVGQERQSQAGPQNLAAPLSFASVNPYHVGIHHEDIKTQSSSTIGKDTMVERVFAGFPYREIARFRVP